VRNEIHGICAPRFDRVREAFVACFDEGIDTGARVAVVHRGELVADLFAGERWRDDTLTTVLSVTKGFAALAVAMLVDRALLDYDAPVRRYWPGFASEGKADVSVGDLLAHRAGLPVIDAPLPPGAASDWERMVRALEQQPPLWKPGDASGYHAVSFSWLAGELFRRVVGVSLGAFVRDEIARPLGIELWIGAPADVEPRHAALVIPPPTPGQSSPPALFLRALALGNPPLAPPLDSRAFRALELCSTNGLAHARGVATLYGVLALGGEPLLRPATLAQSTAQRFDGIDAVVGVPARRGYGWTLNSGGGRVWWGPSARSFGHSGAGGSLGFADPDAGIGFGYTTTHLISTTGPEPRRDRLVEAVYASLG
jgi:CubicO group peptidase (beta-lactamase class C family)